MPRPIEAILHFVHRIPLDARTEERSQQTRSRSRHSQLFFSRALHTTTISFQIVIYGQSQVAQKERKMRFLSMRNSLKILLWEYLNSRDRWYIVCFSLLSWFCSVRACFCAARFFFFSVFFQLVFSVCAVLCTVQFSISVVQLLYNVHCTRCSTVFPVVLPFACPVRVRILHPNQNLLDVSHFRPFTLH